MNPEKMSWEYLSKYSHFLNYISTEPELPVALTQIWDEYYNFTVKLLEFGHSKGIAKEDCELYLKLPKPQMYDIVRMDLDILQTQTSLLLFLISHYRVHYLQERKEYLFGLKIADMTEDEYRDLVKIINMSEKYRK